MHIPVFCSDDFKDHNRLYMSGAKPINIHATGSIMAVVVGTLKDIISELNIIINKEKLL